MWKLKQQSNYFTRTWLFKVFLSVWFCGFAVTAKADTNDVAEILAILSDVYRSGGSVIREVPYSSAAGSISLGRELRNGLYAGPTQDLSVAPQSPFLGSILALLNDSNPKFFNFLRSLSSSNDLARAVSILSGLGDLTNGWGYATADTLHSQMDQVEYYLQGIWGSAALQVEFRHDNHGNELLVAAPDIEDVLDAIEQNQRTIATLLFDLSSGERSNFSSNFYEMGDYIAGSVSNSAAEIIDYLDQDVSSEYDDSAEDAEDATDDYLDEYDDIPLTSSSETYNTQAADPTGPETSDIFGDLSTSGVSHSAILQLVDTSPPSRSTSIDPIPEIEVDFGRDGAFTGFCGSLNDLTDWLYPILGTLFLSLKGLRMWRLVRQATIAASASGEPPVLNLAYDPF